MVRRVLTLVLLGVMAVVGAGCGGAGGSEPADLRVACEDLEAAGSTVVERELEVAVGAEFAVTLCSNPSTGFTWEDPTSEGDAGVDVLGRDTAEPADAQPGTPGWEVFSFRATGAGAETIHFAYSQPWAGGTKGAWLVDVALTVR